jgi:hypothetical protein
MLPSGPFCTPIRGYFWKPIDTLSELALFGAQTLRRPQVWGLLNSSFEEVREKQGLSEKRAAAKLVSKRWSQKQLGLMGFDTS